MISSQTAQAVAPYLARYALADQIPHVITPGTYPPGHLQPYRRSLEDAFRALAATPADCALITASAVGIEAVRNAGAHSIGYATTPAVYELVAAAGADSIVPSLADLTLRLRPRPFPS